MSDEIRTVELKTIIGATLTKAGQVALFFETDGDRLNVLHPVETARKSATMALNAAADLDRSVSGLAVDSIDLKSAGDGWHILEFGQSRGVIPIALDQAQVDELRQLLKSL